MEWLPWLQATRADNNSTPSDAALNALFDMQKLQYLQSTKDLMLQQHMQSQLEWNINNLHEMVKLAPKQEIVQKQEIIQQFQ